VATTRNRSVGSGDDAQSHDHPQEHRPLSKTAQAALERVRRYCLALPEATEKETWGTATFRVRDQIFLMAGGGTGLEITLKAPPGAQEVLVSGDAEHCFVPAYVGHRGWIGVRIDRSTNWGLVEELIEDSWRMTAPKRLHAVIAHR